MDNTITSNTIRSILLTVLVVLMIAAMAGSASAITYATVTYPDGGENVRGTVNLTWDSDGAFTDALYLYYSSNNGTLWSFIQASPVAGDTRYYLWDTTSRDDESNYAIRVYYNGTINDRSNTSFTIDNTDPSITANAPINQWVANETVVELNVTASDATGIHNVTADVSAVNQTLSTVTLTNVAGNYWTVSIIADKPTAAIEDITVTARDNATDKDGINNTAAVNLSLGVDDVIPSVTANAPIDLWVNNGTAVTLNATIADTGSGVKNATVDVSAINSTQDNVTLTLVGGYWIGTVSVSTANTNAQNLPITAYDNVSNANTSVNMTVQVDNDKPTYTPVSEPTTGNTGESVLVNVSATDNIAVTSYNITIDGAESVMDKSGAYYTKTINIPSDSTANIVYNCTFKDAADNSNTTSTKTIVVTDNDKPTYTPVSEPTTGNTGESVLVNVSATDNIAVTSYNITIDGAESVMDKSGAYYTKTINIPSDSTANIVYNCTFKDAADNSNTTSTKTIVVTDNDKPTYTPVSEPTTGNTGESVLVNVSATDNIAVTSYNITIDGAESVMDKSGAYYTKTINIPSDSTANIVYNCTFKDAADNSNTTSTKTIVVTDNDKPTYTPVSEPTTGNTGESVLVNVSATDNIAVTSYNITIDGAESVMDKSGAYYTKTINIPSDSTANIVYNCTFKDAADNSNTTSTKTIVVTDNDKPTYTPVSEPTTGNTGESVLVNVSATDNIAVTSYNITIDGAESVMDKSGAYYTKTINIPSDSTANIVYNCTFKDAADNSNTTSTKTIVVTDNDKPTYTPVSEPTTGNTGESVLVNVSATDNIAVTSYNITIDGAESVMDKSGAYYTKTINIPSDSTANIVYNCTFKDAADNSNTTSTKTIVVTDNDKPTYTPVSEPTTGNTGESVLVNVSATDNIAVTSYNITIDGAESVMDKSGAYYTKTINIPSDSTANIVYNCTFKDAADNSNTTSTKTIVVTDNDKPTYTPVSEPTTGNTGESVLVNVSATDNIAVTSYNITIDGAESVMDKSGAYYTKTINIPSDSTANIVYNCTFKDAADNSNTTSTKTIVVTDNDKPTYTPVSEPTTGNTGESVLVNVSATDNIAVTSYNITIDGAESVMDKSGAYYTKTINIPSDSTANIVYNCTFKDAAGNSNTTADTTITVTDNDAPTAPGTPTHSDDAPSGFDNDTTLNFTWTGSTDNIGVSHYNVTISVNGGTFGTQINVGANLTYNITTVVDGSNYSIKVYAYDAAGNSNVSSPSAIITCDTTPPVANAGPDQIGINVGATVTFNGSGSSDAGGSGIASYSWNFGDGNSSTGVAPTHAYGTGGMYTVTLTVTDNASNTNTDTMSVAVAVKSYSISLNTGWNMVSTPLIPDNTAIGTVLSGMNNVDGVYIYDALNATWVYNVSGHGDLTNITAGKGYWFQMNASETLTIHGSFLPAGETPPTYPVYTGWNLIGFHSLSADIPYDYLSNVRGNYASKMYGYKNGAWVTVNNADVSTGADELEPGYGYWLYMQQNGIITP